jgi:hypothetical protein
MPESLGPPCAYGSRATLPTDKTAARVILANACADYLECIGWKTGAARREYLRAAALEYCAHCDIWPDAFGAPIVEEVISYMRRHVAACVAVMRRRRTSRHIGD